MLCLNGLLERFFYRYAFYVARYWYLFVIVPACLTAFLSSGFYFMKSQTQNDTEFVFTPTDGRAKYEKRTFAEHFPLQEENFLPGQSFDVKRFVHVIITGNGEGNSNLLRPDLLDQVVVLNSFLLNTLNVTSYDDQHLLFYRALCLKVEMACFDNPHVSMLRHMDELEKYGNLIRYPVMRMPYDAPFSVGGLLGNVTFNETTGQLFSVGAIRLVFHMKSEKDMNFYSIQFRDFMSEYLLAYRSRLIKVSFGNDDSLNQGLRENTVQFAPQIGVTVALVFLFSYLCSFVFYRPLPGGAYFVDWVRSKPHLAVIGTLVPGMSVVSSMGLILLCGGRYNDIVAVMPFLTFAIGIDNMFIQIATWHETHQQDAEPQKRFAAALSRSAVAISITLSNDIVSFGVGAWNPLPAMQIFCYYAALAMFFELLYQITFYSAFLYVFGQVECQAKHSVTFSRALAFSDAESKCQQYFCTGSTSHKNADIVTNRLNIHNPFGSQSDSTDGLSLVQIFIRNYYAKYLLKPATMVFVAVLFVVYLTAAIYGALTMRQGLQPEKLVSKKHYAYDFLWSDRYWTNGMPAQVLVNNAPDLSVYENRQQVLEVVRAFENSRHTLDASFTSFFLREYAAWVESRYAERDSANSTRFTSAHLKAWIASTGSRLLWMSDIQWGDASLNQTDRMLAFRFRVGLKDFALPVQHQDAVELLRQLGDAHAALNISCYTAQSAYVDQYLIIGATTARNTLLSLAIMVLMALVLIPDAVCGVFMTLSVLSIDLGTTGFLNYWGVNMDCISMVTIIMATGFAVDLSALVSYGYVRAAGTPRQRAAASLESLGWPVVQGVAATFLGVLVMGTVDAYIIATFFKTVVLVIFVGLLHSVVFLPVALTLFVRPWRRILCDAIKTAAGDDVFT